MSTDWTDSERGQSVDSTVAVLNSVKEILRRSGKGTLRITREVSGVGSQHWSLKADLKGGPLDIEVEARGLSLHEAAMGMQIILEGVL